jgi:hypothetical protein
MKHGGPRAAITRTMFPVVVPAEMMTTIVASLRNLILLNWDVKILNSPKKTGFP